MTNRESSGSVKSALRTLDILELLTDQARPMLATEISDALAIPLSSLSYLLTTLVDRRYLERRGRSYIGGEMLKRFGNASGSSTFAERIAPFVTSVRNKTTETSVFFVRDGFEIQAVLSERGNHALQYLPPNVERSPIHSFAAGKAILSTFDEKDLKTYFSTVPRERFTETTLVTETELREELAIIKKTGFAVAKEENTPGVNAIAKPVIVGKQPLGALSVAIPTVRFNAASELHTMESLDAVTQRLMSIAQSECWIELSQPSA